MHSVLITVAPPQKADPMTPSSSTILALALSDYVHTHAVDVSYRQNGKIAYDATLVVTIAASVRRIVELACNTELTSRQEKRKESLRKRANAILLHYGLKLDNPWGLCHYACPIGHDGGSESSCIFLA